MKLIFQISFQSLQVNKRNSAVIFLVMLLSMAFLMTVCTGWLALIDLQANILFEDFKDSLAAENLYDKVYHDPIYLDVIRTGILFILIAAFIAGVSIRNVLILNEATKAKTLSILTTLGAKAHHRFVFLISDSLLLVLAAIPSGLLLGGGISALLLRFLNQEVCGRAELPELVFLQGKPWLYCPIVAGLGFFSVLLVSLRPALKGLKRTPVEIAKSKDAVSVVLRETWFDRVIIRCFGVCGKLASANYENYRHRYRMFTRTLSLSAAFFVLVELLIAYMRPLESSVDAATTDNFFRFFLYFTLAVLILSLSGACSILYVQFQKRRHELALLLSTGITKAQLCGMLAVEMLYYAFRFLFGLLLISFIGGLLLYFSYPFSDVGFIFPWKDILTLGCGILILLFVISLCMLRTVKKLCIIDELKKSD